MHLSQLFEFLDRFEAGVESLLKHRRSAEGTRTAAADPALSIGLHDPSDTS